MGREMTSRATSRTSRTQVHHAHPPSLEGVRVYPRGQNNHSGRFSRRRIRQRVRVLVRLCWLLLGGVDAGLGRVRALRCCGHAWVRTQRTWGGTPWSLSGGNLRRGWLAHTELSDRFLAFTHARARWVIPTGEIGFEGELW